MPVGTWNGKAWVDEQGKVLSTDPNGGAPVQSGGGSIQALNDVIVGAGKGAGSTVFNLGKLVHNTPGLGNLTDELSKLVAPFIVKMAGGDNPGLTDPSAAFSQEPLDLKAKNTAQKVGKVGEQMAEFFLPTGGAATDMDVLKTVTSNPKLAFLEPLLTKTASSGVQSLNKVGKAVPLAADAVKTGVQAAMTSAAHGDQSPEQVGLTAATGPLMGAAAAKAVPLIDTTTAQHLIPAIGALLATKPLTGMMGTEIGLGSSLGLYGAMRAIIADALKNPDAIGNLQSLARRTLPLVSKGAAATQDQLRAQKRTLPAQ